MTYTTLRKRADEARERENAYRRVYRMMRDTGAPANEVAAARARLMDAVERQRRAEGDVENEVMRRFA